MLSAAGQISDAHALRSRGRRHAKLFLRIEMNESRRHVDIIVKLSSHSGDANAVEEFFFATFNSQQSIPTDESSAKNPRV